MYYEQTHIQESILPRHMWRYAGMQELHMLLPYMILHIICTPWPYSRNIYCKYPAVQDHMYSTPMYAHLAFIDACKLVHVHRTAICRGNGMYICVNRCKIYLGVLGAMLSGVRKQ